MRLSVYKGLLSILLIFVSVDNLVAAVSDHSAEEVNPTEPHNKALAGRVNRSETLLIFDNDITTSTSPGEFDQSVDSEETPLVRLNAVRTSIRAFVYPVLLVLSSFGSITTIVVLQKGALRSSCSVYISGVAVANTMSMILYAMSVLNQYKAISSTLAWQNFNQYRIVYTYPISYIVYAIEAWTVIALAMERLLAIFKPLKAHVICCESRAKKIVCGIYVAAVLVNLPRYFSRGIKTEFDPVNNVTRKMWYYTEFGKDPLHNRIESFFFAIAGSVAPVLMLGLLNMLIIFKLRQVRKKQQALKEGMAKDITNGANVQVERVLIASISSFFVCHSVVATVFFAQAVYGLSIFTEFDYIVRMTVFSIMYLCYPFVNFFLFVCCSQILRDAVKDLFCLKRVLGQA